MRAPSPSSSAASFSITPEHARGVEAGRVADDDDRLAHARAEAHRGRRRACSLAAVGPDHFEQRHAFGGREEVHADDALGMLGSGRDLVNGHRRRVGGDHRIRRDNLLEVADHVAFEVEVLEDRFDDDVGAGEARVVGGARDSAAGWLGPRVREAAACDAARRRSSRIARQSAGDGLGSDVAHAHGKPGGGGDLGDRRAHEARADHAELR